jgi:hypothetical protein
MVAPNYFYKLKKEMEGNNIEDHVDAYFDEENYEVKLKAQDKKQHQGELDRAMKKVNDTVEDHHHHHDREKNATVPWWHYNIQGKIDNFSWETHRRIDRAYQQFKKGKYDNDKKPRKIKFERHIYFLKFHEGENDCGELVSEKKGINTIKIVREEESWAKHEADLPKSAGHQHGDDSD